MINSSKAKIIRIVSELEVDLAKHKNPSAEYFKEIKEDLISIENDEDFRVYVERLRSIGPIGQSFNFSQETLLDQLIDEIISMLI